VSLTRKLVLITLVAAVLPLGVVGLVTLNGAERAVRERFVSEQLAAARAAAAAVAADLARVERTLGPVAATTDAERLLAPDLRGEAERRLRLAAGSGGTAFLLAADGRVLAASGRDTARAPPGRAVFELSVQSPPAGRLPDATLAAWAPVEGGRGIGVLVRVPEGAAFEDLSRLRRTALATTLAVLAVLLAVTAGIARGLGREVARIQDAAGAIGGGDLSVRLPEDRADELGALSRAFNAMANELARTHERRERWNEELQREVEARTRDLREAQARVVEAQKLAAIGQLGAGVAHEINNPLTGILGHAQLLLEEWPLGDERREPLEKIEQLARRCRDVTQKLLRFSHQRIEPEFDDLDLNRVVTDALALAEGQVRAVGIALEVSLADPAPRVRGDAGHLGQVVLNLLSNARTACLGRPGRRILISTRVRDRQVELRVEDDGKGIAPEVLPHVFEPFFTTKDLWSNVGLGLSVAWRIAEEHGGRIEVDSSRGRGAAFTMTLPAAAAV
jgi:C4-dicarboxylate-specific signal transduction histidine kinase